MDKSECGIWLSAAKHVLMVTGVPMHYLDIKRAILNKQLVSSGLKSTLESALQEDSERSTSERMVISVEGQPGYFMCMKHEPEKSEEANNMQASPKQQPKVRHPNETKSKVKGQNDLKPKVKVKLKIETEEKVERTEEPGINIQKIAADKKRNKSKERVSDDTDKCSSNAKYEMKYRKLRRYAKDVIFLNAAYCDEVLYTEEQISKASAERRYLLNRLLHRKSMAAAMSQTASHSPGFPKISSLSRAQSMAQILSSMEKRSKKKAASATKGTSKTAKEEASKPKVKKPVKLSSDFKPKVLESVTIDVTPRTPAFSMETA